MGIMGSVARAAQDAGGETFGVIPTNLVRREIAKTDLSSLVITETMHERKKVMFMNCDAVVLLPGGAGSLDEFFEVLTWAQLGIHDKPVFILNSGSYWQKLVDLIDHVVESGFADPSLRNLFSVTQDVAGLIKELQTLRS